ncbi:hypothetical protein DFH27DRAFT_559967 [Peziza echinospora]|nr:hypothetical protein DFH27DRAFT_559967 [Peziza echinospora]
MLCKTFTCFLSSLLAFESGWDRDSYNSGHIQTSQLNEWARGPVSAFYPNYTSWSDLTPQEWEAMAYRSMNSLGFVGYQFGEALLSDLGYYYDDDLYYGAGGGAEKNTWDGTWLGKRSVYSLDDFLTKDVQDEAIKEAFGWNLQILKNLLWRRRKKTVMEVLGQTKTYRQKITIKTGNGTTSGGGGGLGGLVKHPTNTNTTYITEADGSQVHLITVNLTLTGILAACHLRGAVGTAALLLDNVVSVDEYGTSILKYIEKFGGYESPTVQEMIARYPIEPDFPEPESSSRKLVLGNWNIQMAVIAWLFWIAWSFVVL